MKIGRALENELVVSDLQVSRYHAEFRAHPDGRYEIVDLGSHNGTYVNGQPVQRHLLGPNDIVGVGHSTFRLVGDRLEEFVDTGAVSFSARRLSVTVPHGKTTKTILKDVSFGVPEKSLIGVIGPSGSGKSTLLRAADRLPPRRPGRGALRQPEPVQAVRRAAPAHRPGPAGRHPAQGTHRSGTRCSTPPSSASPATPRPPSARRGSTRCCAS